MAATASPNQLPCVLALGWGKQISHSLSATSLWGCRQPEAPHSDSPQPMARSRSLLPLTCLSGVGDSRGKKSLLSPVPRLGVLVGPVVGEEGAAG